MGLRFRKSIRVGKFFRINLSKRGVGYSAGIPGSGVSYGVSPGQPKPGEVSGCAGCALIVGVLFLGMCVVPSLFRPWGQNREPATFVQPALQRRIDHSVETRPEPPPASGQDLTPGPVPLDLPDAPGESAFERPARRDVPADVPPQREHRRTFEGPSQFDAMQAEAKEAGAQKADATTPNPSVSAATKERQRTIELRNARRSKARAASDERDQEAADILSEMNRAAAGKVGPVQVRGYIRSDGTYVPPHTRSR